MSKLFNTDKQLELAGPLGHGINPHEPLNHLADLHGALQAGPSHRAAETFLSKASGATKIEAQGKLSTALNKAYMKAENVKRMRIGAESLKEHKEALKEFGADAQVLLKEAKDAIFEHKNLLVEGHAEAVDRLEIAHTKVADLFDRHVLNKDATSGLITGKPRFYGREFDFDALTTKEAQEDLVKEGREFLNKEIKDRQKFLNRGLEKEIELADKKLAFIAEHEGKLLTKTGASVEHAVSHSVTHSVESSAAHAAETSAAHWTSNMSLANVGSHTGRTLGFLAGAGVALGAVYNYFIKERAPGEEQPSALANLAVFTGGVVGMGAAAYRGR